MKEPLVSVVCLCYNHRDFVAQAMTSVLGQSYDNVELIVVDDCSTDGSQDIINEYRMQNPSIKVVLRKENGGNCLAFNEGWHRARGKYIIDLAADDYLLPDRIARGVSILESKGRSFGVHFTDAQIVDRFGRPVRQHLTGSFYHPVPEGYIFPQLLEKYFINPVSMMIRNEVLKSLGGFDESLAYEDFDFWVRSSKEYQYCYSAEVLVVKRLLKNSHSTRQYKFRSAIIESTYQVCEKAYTRCENRQEFQALKKRVSYEMKKAGQSLNLKTVRKFFKLWQRINSKLKELS